MSKDIKVVAFNFTNLLINRNSSNKFDINSNIKVVNIEKEEIELLNKPAFKVIFEFVINYGDAGNIVFKGFFIAIMEDKEVKILLKEWESKTLSEEMNLFISNLIFQKCSIKAAQLEEDFNFPLHFSFPRFVSEKGKESKKYLS